MVLLPTPEKYLQVKIFYKNGKELFPFFSVNPDNSISIGFHAAEVGDCSVKVVYWLNDDLKELLCLVHVTPPHVVNNKWKLEARKKPVCKERFELVLKPLVKLNKDADPDIGCLRFGSFPRMISYLILSFFLIFLSNLLALEMECDGDEFILSALPTVEGKFSLHVTIGKDHVLGSPFFGIIFVSHFYIFFHFPRASFFFDRFLIT